MFNLMILCSLLTITTTGLATDSSRGITTSNQASELGAKFDRGPLTSTMSGELLSSVSPSGSPACFSPGDLSRAVSPIIIFGRMPSTGPVATVPGDLSRAVSPRMFGRIDSDQLVDDSEGMRQSHAAIARILALKR